MKITRVGSLEWQQESPESMTLKNAIKNAKKTRKNGDEWRLPTTKEMVELLSVEHHSGRHRAYWCMNLSHETVWIAHKMQSPRVAPCCEPATGNHMESHNCFVRLVRDVGETLVSATSEDTKETIADGKEWSDTFDPMAWMKASECAAMAGNGWRFPTVKELLTLFDRDRNECRISPRFRIYWTSVPHVADASFCVDVTIGSVAARMHNEAAGVMLVRDVA